MSWQHFMFKMIHERQYSYWHAAVMISGKFCYPHVYLLKKEHLSRLQARMQLKCLLRHQTTLREAQPVHLCFFWVPTSVVVTMADSRSWAGLDKDTVFHTRSCSGARRYSRYSQKTACLFLVSMPATPFGLLTEEISVGRSLRCAGIWAFLCKAAILAENKRTWCSVHRSKWMGFTHTLETPSASWFPSAGKLGRL